MLYLFRVFNVTFLCLIKFEFAESSKSIFGEVDVLDQILTSLVFMEHNNII